MEVIVEQGEQYDRICKDKFEGLDRKQDRIIALLEGNGTPGLRIEVDRLKQFSAVMLRILYIIGGATLCSLVEMVMRLI